MRLTNRVHSLVKKIPKGKVSTYAELAKAVGSPKAARAVGNALNAFGYTKGPAVPCHRVIKSTGKVGGFARGTRMKIALLKKEGIVVSRGRVRNFKEVKYKFK